MKQFIQSILMAAILLISLNHSVSSENNQRVYVEDLQSHLSAAGYDIGKVDGEWGERSNAALIKYLQDNSFPQGTKITAELFKTIRTRLRDKAPPLSGEGENPQYFIGGVLSNSDSILARKMISPRVTINDKLKARKTINAFMHQKPGRAIIENKPIAKVKTTAEMRLAIKKRKSLKPAPPLKTRTIIYGNGISFSEVISENKSFIPISTYDLAWTMPFQSLSAKEISETIMLYEVYWSDHYPFKSFGQGTYYPGIEPYLTKRKWHHTDWYRKTVATKISDPKFQDFIVEVMKAKMQSFQTDGIFLDFWNDNHTHYSGYSKNKVRKARIEIAKKLRSEIGPDKIIMGNVNWSKDKATVPYINGVFLELYKKDPKKTYRTSELKKIEGSLNYYEKNLQPPKLVALQGARITRALTDEDRNTPENRKMAKLLTAMSVVVPTNGYILYSDGNFDSEKSDSDHIFYDFYKFDIGKPTSGYIKVKAGVGYKEHKQGFIAYNITNKSQKITRANGQKHQVEAKSGLFCKDVGSKVECLSVD